MIVRQCLMVAVVVVVVVVVVMVEVVVVAAVVQVKGSFDGLSAYCIVVVVVVVLMVLVVLYPRWQPKHCIQFFRQSLARGKLWPNQR